MKKISTILLQTTIVLVSIGVFVWLLWEPHLEGVNANTTNLSEIYLDDPFLIYAYVASIAFFVALYKGLRILSYFRQNKTFSPVTVKALRTIRYCALTLIGFIIGGSIWLLLGESDDRPPIIMIGIILTIISLSVATTSAMFERIILERQS